MEPPRAERETQETGPPAWTHHAVAELLAVVLLLVGVLLVLKWWL